MALSSCEAELIALVDTAKRVKMIRHMAEALGLNLNNKPTPIYCDNEGARKVVTATGTTRRMRHVDTQYFAIQDWHRKKHVDVRRIDTKVNASDLMTKCLQRTLHHRHTRRLMGYYGPNYPNLRLDSTSVLGTDGSHEQGGV